MANISSPEMLKPELWYPGGPNLDADYPNATDEQFIELWSKYSHGLAEARALHSVYGVYNLPDKPIKAIASIDACEVLRDTSIAFKKVVGLRPRRTYDYAEDSWITRDQPPEYERQVVTDSLRVLMSLGLVPPVEHSTAIGSILRSWRRQGVYTTVNTSTLPGCEIGTITYTLGRDYPDCFDAIIFPRNHDGKGLVTKATALNDLALETGLPSQDVPVVHVDDAVHHMQDFIGRQLLFPDLSLFIPEHETNRDKLDSELYYASPLDAFLGVDEHFKDRGVIS